MVLSTMLVTRFPGEQDKSDQSFDPRTLVPFIKGSLITIGRGENRKKRESEVCQCSHCIKVRLSCATAPEYEFRLVFVEVILIARCIKIPGDGVTGVLARALNWRPDRLNS